MCRKAREGVGVGMDSKLATPASRFVERSLVPVLEGFQEEEEDVRQHYRDAIVQYVTTRYVHKHHVFLACEGRNN